jgi:Phosphotransferase enzyme family
MLSRADADLVRRDPALPALGTALDPEAFAAVLRRIMPDSVVEPGQISYVRYKPGMSCLIGYRFASGKLAPFVSAAAFRANAQIKLNKARSRPGRTVLDELALVVSVFPHDDKLNALERLADPNRRQRMLMKLLPELPKLWAGDIVPIRFKPDRRYVATLSVEGIPEAVLKFYGRDGFDSAWRSALAFQSGATFRIPALLGCSPRRRALAWQWLPGRSLTAAMNDERFLPRSVAAVGAALAELHGQLAAPLESRPRHTEAASLPAVAKWVAHICPSLSHRAHRLADRLARRLAEMPAENQSLHGDFYASQVLLDGTSIRLTDFDEAFRGDPAHDLGTFLAHLEANAVRCHLPRDLVAPVTAALVDGYRDCARDGVTDDRIALYTSVGLLRLAAHPFRSREPLWPKRTAAILERADKILQLPKPQLVVGAEPISGASQ